MTMFTENAKPEQALRYNTGKPQWSLVDWPSLLPFVGVLEYGAEKYTVRDPQGNIISTGADNWKKGLPVKKLLDSLMRHVMDLMNGKTMDDESKLAIIGHIMCNAMFIQWMLTNKPEMDDRTKAIPKDFLQIDTQ